MRNLMLLLTTLLLPILLLIALAVRAELKVIADLGGEDTAPFYEGINRQSRPAVPSAVQSLPQGESAMLPVKTPELTPGSVIDRQLRLSGIGALFLVGDDEISRRWLSVNAERLAKKNAAGLIVNVSNIDSVSTLRALAPDVQMVPASGSELARRLQLQHYPVLITDTGLSQQMGLALHE